LKQGGKRKTRSKSSRRANKTRKGKLAGGSQNRKTRNSRLSNNT